MAIIPLPTRFGFSDIPNFTLARASNEVRSKYTAVRQVLVYPYAVWMLEGSLVDLQGKDAARLRSFLVQLEGKQNKFRLPVPDYYRPSTGYLGDGLVFTNAAARAKSIQVSGLAPNTPIIGDGEYFNVGDELKMASSDIASDANGRCVIPFQPALRKTALANLAVKLQNPTILMHSQDDDVASWGIKPANRQTAKFRAIEAIEL
jgi:hypothetical protein